MRDGWIFEAHKYETLVNYAFSHDQKSHGMEYLAKKKSWNNTVIVHNFFFL